MDSGLKERLSLIDKQIEKLFHVEREFFLLEGSEKSFLASLTIKSLESSHAAKQNEALASAEWESFSDGMASHKSEYLREKRKLELLIKAFDAEYLTYKVENRVIQRQL